jgi:hypothetical protein
MDMRNEEWWTREEHQQYSDFYHYWDCQHDFGNGIDCEGGHNDYDDDDDWGNWDDDYWGDDDWMDDVECEDTWKNIEVRCSDFEMFAGEECDVSISYNPCVDDTFDCMWYG